MEGGEGGMGVAGLAVVTGGTAIPGPPGGGCGRGEGKTEGGETADGGGTIEGGIGGMDGDEGLGEE